MYNSNLQKDFPFENVTHKEIYCELIRLGYKEHHSKKKWEEKFLQVQIHWPTVWKTLNNPVTSEETRSKIWQQIHLNDYNTFSYNKWHNNQQKCPFCFQMPKTFSHLTIECQITLNLWTELEPHLLAIHPVPVTNIEKVFGIQGRGDNKKGSQTSLQ